MKIAVLGTGLVGHTLATKLVELGHQVMMGSRTLDNEPATTWAAEGTSRSHGTFTDAALLGDEQQVVAAAAEQEGEAA